MEKFERLEELEKNEKQKSKEVSEKKSLSDFLKTYNDPINFHKHIGAIPHDKLDSQIQNLINVGYGKKSDGEKLENLPDDYWRSAILIEKIKTLPGVPGDRSDEEVFKNKRQICEESPGKYRDIKRYLQAWLYSHNYFDKVQNKKSICLESDGIILFNNRESKTIQAKEAYNNKGLSIKRVEYKESGSFMKSDSFPVWNNNKIEQESVYNKPSRSIRQIIQPVNDEKNELKGIKISETSEITQEKFDKMTVTLKGITIFRTLQGKLQSKGVRLKDFQIWGIVGNMYGESKFKTTATSKSGKYKGICQRDINNRFKEMTKQYPGEERKKYTNQLDFLVNELTSSEKLALNAVAGSTNIFNATNEFQQKFERTTKKVVHRDRYLFSEFCSKMYYSGFKSTDDLEKIMRDQNIANVLGDSWGEGLSKTKENFIKGATLDQVRTSLSVKAKKDMPNVLFGGTNDRIKFKNKDKYPIFDLADTEFRANLDNIITDAEGKGIKIVFCTIPPLRDPVNDPGGYKLQRLNQAILDQQSRVNVIDVNSHMTDAGSSYKYGSDGNHLASMTEYQKLSQYLQSQTAIIS